MEWISKKYLDKEFYEIFQKNKGKKIIVFGAGSALNTIPELLPNNVNISYFVDNKYEQWQQAAYEVKSPIELLTEEKGTIIVLIASQHTISIKEQLKSYGFIETKDYIDLYSKYEKAFRIAKVDYEAVEVQDFIERFSDNNLTDNVNFSKKIGVVVSYTIFGTQLYDIALFFLLKKRGYNVELIIDDCYSNENITIYDGVTEDIKNIMDKVIEQIKIKFNKISINYISSYGKTELNGEDLLLVDEAVHANAMWQRSRKIDRMMKITQVQWESLTYPIYKENLERIKSFFMSSKFDVINICTGHHGQRYFYPTLGERLGIRVTSYDGGGTLGAMWTTNGRATHRMDICKVIKEKLLSEEEKKIIVSDAKRSFYERSHSKKGDNSIVANYQNGERKKVTKEWFDVVIPLNIMWDSSALGNNRVFSSEFEWLEDTVDYILRFTKSKILVREHPAATLYGEFNFDSFGKRLSMKYRNEERIYVAEASDILNTYEYIEHCKVVLPFTSTVGVEAVLLGKQVISHTNVYYDDLGFVIQANSKEEYFEYVREAIENRISEKNKECQDAWIAYWLGMNYDLETDFVEGRTVWRGATIEELDKMKGVDEICMSIAENVPICYQNMKHTINKIGRKS